MNRKILLVFVDGLLDIANGKDYVKKSEVRIRLPAGVLAVRRNQTPLQRQLIALSCDLLAMNDGKHQQLHRTLLSMAACICRNMDGLEFANVHSLHFCENKGIYYDPDGIVWFGNLLPATHRLRTFCDDFMSVLSGRSALVADEEETQGEILRPGVYSTALTNPLAQQLDLFGDIIARQSGEDTLTDPPKGMPSDWISREDDKLSSHVWNIMLGLLVRDNLLPEEADPDTIIIEKGQLRYQIKQGSLPETARQRLLVA